MRTVTTLVGRSGLWAGRMCLPTAVRALGPEYRFRILEDGSLGPAEVEELLALVPGCEIVSRDARAELVDEQLSRFPACRRFRAENVLAQKLFDPILLNPGERLEYIDSDVYFLRPLRAGLRPSSDEANGAGVSMFLADVSFAYSLSVRVLSGLPAHSIPGRVNTGIISFPSEAFDLSYLEWVLAQEDIKRCFLRTPCWAEQTCWAFLAGRTATRLIDPQQGRIVTGPGALRALGPAVALHFVSSYRDLLRSGTDALVQEAGDTGVEWRTSPAEYAVVLDLLFSGAMRRATSRARRMFGQQA